MAGKLRFPPVRSSWALRMSFPTNKKLTAAEIRRSALSYGLALVSIAAAFGLARVFLHFHLPQRLLRLRCLLSRSLSGMAVRGPHLGGSAVNPHP